jgi:hypothetical protein
MTCKGKHFIGNHILETSKDHKGNDHDRQSNGYARYSNAMNGPSESSGSFKTDSFGNEVGKIQ